MSKFGINKAKCGELNRKNHGNKLKIDKKAILILFEYVLSVMLKYRN